MMLRNSTIILSFLLLVSLITGCSSNATENITSESVNELSSQERTINIDKLEVYHFHGTHQCYSCKTVGAYAEETINTYFKDELESGEIVFDHINGELPENRELVAKYGTTGSSLWLGTYKGDDFQAEEDVNIWYKIRDKQDYMNYLKDLIEKKLAGN